MDFWEIACIFAHSKRERMKYTLLAKDRKSEARRGMLTTDDAGLNAAPRAASA